MKQIIDSKRWDPGNQTSDNIEIVDVLGKKTKSTWNKNTRDYVTMGLTPDSHHGESFDK